MQLNPFKKKIKRKQQSPVSGSWLKPETKKAVAGVLLLLFSLIVIFSFFDQAGQAGKVILYGLHYVMGYLVYLSPILFGYIGYQLLRPRHDGFERWQIVGSALLIVGLLGTFHLVGVPVDDSLQVASEGKGGGFLGFLLSYPLSLALSPLIAIIIYLAVLLIGVFMTFNLSPTDVLRWIKGMFPSKDEEDQSDDIEVEVKEGKSKPKFRISRMGGVRNSAPDPAQLRLEKKQIEKEQEQKKLRMKQVKAVNKKYHPPSLDLLDSSSIQPEGGNIDENKKIIEATLQNFGINVTVGQAKVGPTVTQYTLRPDEGIRLVQITALQNDLSRALKAHPVRIEAPIPNTDLVGIEIPNKKVALVRLRDILASKEMKDTESPLSFTLGRDVSGGIAVAELDRMPHMLIAGATNSGKSVCIHSILMSLLYRNSPELLRLILIDPKRVELTAYNGIPHLRGEPVIVDTNKTLNALKWAIREMDDRYKLLEESGSRNLSSYNASNPENIQPFIVIVVDELADLMAKHAREVEGPIVRLSQLARAVGIHLILATQRPSVNVITGLIKANVPARIAFKVASQIDSRTILDMAGAEKLVGTGDMLYLSSDNSKPRRLQGAFVSEDEVRHVVKSIIENNEIEEYVEDESITVGEQSRASGGASDTSDEPLFEEARRIAVESGKISASLLQRRLRVGYARGARLLDMLEDEGVIGPADGNKPREVMLKEDDSMTTVSQQEDSHKEENINDEDINNDNLGVEEESGDKKW